LLESKVEFGRFRLCTAPKPRQGEVKSETRQMMDKEIHVGYSWPQSYQKVAIAQEAKRPTSRSLRGFNCLRFV